jgi:RimJ/RimL family protein N-acetyltransferase/catechol 2,3-dioxygenase-like lactoylglutathione lyase family enzyme
MQTNGSKFKNLQPLIPAQNVDKAVSFYCETLGFQKVWADANPANLAILYRGDVQVFLSVDPVADHARATSLRIGVENIEQLYSEYGAKDVIHPNGKLTTKPWGLKEFIILDLNGVCVAFHESPKQKKDDAPKLNPPLETNRLHLLPLSETHFKTMHRIYSDSSVMQNWHTPPHSSMETTEKLLREYVTTNSAWTLELKENGKIIGLVNCHSLEESKPTGMGYIIDLASQGKGFAKEACEAVIRHVFSELNVPQIELWIYDSNEKSIHLAEKLGFKISSTFERSGPDGISRRKTGSYLRKQSDWWKSLN